jgi:membrane protease subunit HflK
MALMQKVLDRYEAGVQITQVQMQKVAPPQQTIDAFREVQAARIGAESAQNEAQAYANRVLPDARGRSEQIKQAAEAYREQTVAEAKGQASRFSQSMTNTPRPQKSRKRMYLETLEACWALRQDHPRQRLGR